MALNHTFQNTNRLLFENKQLLTFAKTSANPTIRQIVLGTIYLKQILYPTPPPIREEWIADHIGFGIFTTQPLPANTFIGTYAGLVRKPSILNKPSDYLLQYPLQDETGLYLEVDAQSWGNFTRHINHSATPNLTLENASLNNLYYALFTTNQAIPANTQLTFDYGPDYWKNKPAPLPL